MADFRDVHKKDVMSLAQAVSGEFLTKSQEKRLPDNSNPLATTTAPLHQGGTRASLPKMSSDPFSSGQMDARATPIGFGDLPLPGGRMSSGMPLWNLQVSARGQWCGVRGL